MADPASSHAQPYGATGCPRSGRRNRDLGQGLRRERHAVGEVCFNTAMTGYQEVMTDPTYAAQIVTFTFPHIGNVGANDRRCRKRGRRRGRLRRARGNHAGIPISAHAANSPTGWPSIGKIGLSGVDTRALTRRIRLAGAPNAVIAHDAARQVRPARADEAGAGLAGLEGMDLAQTVTARRSRGLGGRRIWTLGQGYAAARSGEGGPDSSPTSSPSITARRTTSSAIW